MHTHTHLPRHECMHTCTCCTISLQGIASCTAALKRARCVDAGLGAVVFTCLTFINVCKVNNHQITNHLPIHSYINCRLSLVYNAHTHTRTHYPRQKQTWMHSYLHTLHRHPAGNTQVCSCTQKSQACWCRFGCSCADLSDIHQHLQRDHFTESINISNPMFMSYTYTHTNRRECMHTYVGTCTCYAIIL